MNYQTRFVEVTGEFELFRVPFLYEFPVFNMNIESLLIHNHCTEKPTHTSYELERVDADQVTISPNSDTLVIRTIYLKKIVKDETNTH